MDRAPFKGAHLVKNMIFVSTRGNDKATGPEAAGRGTASDGGLFVPETFPAVTAAEFETLCGMDYPERAAYLAGLFFGEYDKEELLAELRAAYEGFDGEDAAPLVRLDNGMYMLELFHGPTCAEKDLPLAALPYLVLKGRVLAGEKKKTFVLTAGDGDTCKAALEAFRGRENVKITAFYPDEDVSKMQKLQLGTTDGEEVNVVAVRGSGDDCTVGEKRLLNPENRKTLFDNGPYLPTCADSLNIGCIVLQTAVFFSAYCDLLTSDQLSFGDKVDFCVPSGDFSDLVAAFYARKMGLPVGAIVVASNKNSAPSDFLAGGNYNAKRPLYRTMSPVMDVLVPANLERLVYELTGRNAALTAERMKTLAQTGKFSAAGGELAALRENFVADSTDEDGTVECVYDFFTEYGYPMDPHTGVLMSVAERYAEKLQKADPKSPKPPMVVLSPASPYKYPQDVLYALTGNDVKDSYKGVKRIHLLTAMKVPECLKAIRYVPPRFKTVVGADKMADEVKKFL